MNMFKRSELIEEIQLRKAIQDTIRIVRERRGKRKLEEQKLRFVIRDLILESAAVAAVAKHDNTGINALEDLLKNTNVLSTLETGFKSLTTSKQQRDSYRNHILNAVEKSLAPEESRKEAGEEAELDSPVNEEVDIDIGDRPEDDPDFISVEDEEPEEVEEDPKEKFGIEGEDKTGRNRAYTDFQNIEKNILTAFDDLDNPEDITMFEEYLLKNLSLYFDKFESELQTTVDEPTTAAEAEPDNDDDNSSGMPQFELQEVIKHLNINDIINNLL